MKTYYDSFSGLVPVKLESVYTTEAGLRCVRLVVTAKKGPYVKGETIETSARNYVTVTSRSKYSTHISSIST